VEEFAGRAVPLLIVNLQAHGERLLQEVCTYDDCCSNEVRELLKSDVGCISGSNPLISAGEGEDEEEDNERLEC
jgi:hypothetical protein